MSFSRVFRAGLDGLFTFLLALLCLLPLASCDKELPFLLPDVEVRFTVALNLPQYSDLSVPGNVVVVPHQGFNGNGVYLVHELAVPNAFSAYDVTCTAHLESPHATELSGSTAICPYCRTEYILVNFGMSADGNRRLQPYRTHLEGDLLTVY